MIVSRVRETGLNSVFSPRAFERANVFYRVRCQGDRIACLFGEFVPGNAVIQSIAVATHVPWLFVVLHVQGDTRAPLIIGQRS